MNNLAWAAPIAVTILIQSISGVWWASRLQTTQEMHGKQLVKMEVQRENYPVLENRVGRLEVSVDKVVGKLDELIDEMRKE